MGIFFQIGILGNLRITVTKQRDSGPINHCLGLLRILNRSQ
jgi:hypothetical protein